MEYDETHRTLFDNVAFLVEATDTEYLSLWYNHSSESKHSIPGSSPLVWVQEPMGHAIQIGMVASRPTVVSIRYALIERQRVLFYYGCSQLVDHEMIDQWLRHFTEKTIRYDGSRWAHCDAANFHNCVHFLRSKEK